MKVLFVCTANIHRSRFAEEVFNFLAKERNSAHRAFSAGLRVGDYSFRPIYYHALNNLKKLNQLLMKDIIQEKQNEIFKYMQFNHLETYKQ